MVTKCKSVLYAGGGGRNSAIDIVKFIAAASIPCLHINLVSTEAGYFICNYLGRLGVPVFFAISGALLSKSMGKKGSLTAYKQYSIHIGKLLAVWLSIFLPVLFLKNTFFSFTDFIQRILFMTPALLWYLTALLFAVVPFCFIKNRKVLYILAGLGYLWGTMFSQNYRFIFGNSMTEWYDHIFLTTRNGLLMGLFLMCMGELASKIGQKTFFFTHKYFLFIVAFICLYLEIWFVGNHVGVSTDRSQYFLFPLFVFTLMVIVLNSKYSTPHSKVLSDISMMIYVMQYGIILISWFLLKKIGYSNAVIVWINTIVFPVIFYYLIRETRLMKILY